MRLTYTLALCLLLCGLAGANTLTLDPVLVVHQYQQTTNHPCVIGDPSCHQPSGLAMTTLPANASSYDAVSPEYAVSAIRAIVGNTFLIGLDINENRGAQTLSLFEMLINGSVVDTFSSNPAMPLPPTVGGGNGNGYADYTFGNFSSLAGLNPTDTVQFHVVMPSVNDGREEFFLISTAPGPSPVPEPVSMLLTGAGLAAVGLMVRRRKSAAQ